MGSEVVSSKVEGIVKWFDNAKGFGFILNKDGEDVFVRYRNISIEGFKTLKEAQQVSFIQTQCQRAADS